MGNNNSLIIIGVVVIGIILVSSAGAALFATAFSDGFNLEDFLGGLFGGNGGNVAGFTGIGFTVVYDNGDIEEITPQAMQNSILPLTLTVNGKVVSYVRGYVEVNIDSNGATVDSWTAHTELQSEFYKSGLSPEASATAAYDFTGDTFNGEMSERVATFQLTAAQIEDALRQYGHGSYLLQLNAKVKVTASIEGETQEYAVKAPSAGLNFNFAATSQVLSITATAKPYTFP